MKLLDHQVEALPKMSNGCILCGGVGSGKSITSLAYFYKQNGGKIVTGKNTNRMKEPKDLYIITTARKRDKKEWDLELGVFHMSTESSLNLYSNNVVVDSWNNIQKYKDVTNAFFIFDEQRLVGSGAWVKVFLKIAKKNEWILLSATPGDTWMDYVPVFIANGYYKNKTEFIREHVVYSRFTKFPMVDRYINTGKLLKIRQMILVDMKFDRETIAHHKDIYVHYDRVKYKTVSRNRWDPYKNEPIMNASGLAYILRRVVYEDPSRQLALLELLEDVPRAIIFYNYDYELEILRSLHYGKGVKLAEWNGHKHEDIPKSERWVYLVQYTAGAEGWNCVDTDTIIFYSQTYSYKMMVQASGRIDRLNTPFKDLYYYHFKSRSGIDLAVSRALASKQKFNERRYFDKLAKH